MTPAAPRRLSRRKRLVFAVLALGLALLLPLLAAELLLRLFRPQPLTGIMFSVDPEFGSWNRPGLRGKEYQSEQGGAFYRVSTDRQGYRGRRGGGPGPKPEGLRRVLVLGDSFTFGVGVGDAETYPAGAGDALGEGWQVLNAGCPGWGTENMLAFWRARGEALAPDCVVLAFFHNDLPDNMRHYLFRIEQGRVVHDPRPGPLRAKRLASRIPFYPFFSEHSHLVNLLRIAVAEWLRPVQVIDRDKVQPETTKPELTQAPAAAPPEPRPLPGRLGERYGILDRYPQMIGLSERLRVYALLMETLLADLREAGVPVLLLLIPGEGSFWPDPPPDVPAAGRMMQSWAGEPGVHFLDLRPAIGALYREAGPDAVYLRPDRHFTPRANALAGRLLADKLREMLEPSETGEDAP